MPEYTDNLNLAKPKRPDDDDDFLNTDTYLAENFERVDEWAGNITPHAQKLGLDSPFNVGKLAAVLAAVGNLNVWERVQTVDGQPVTDYLVSVLRDAYPDYEALEPQEAYYELGPQEEPLAGDDDSAWNYIQVSNGVDRSFYVSASITVSDTGEVSMVSPSTITVSKTNAMSMIPTMAGKFIRAVTPQSYGSLFMSGATFFIPSNAEATSKRSGTPYYYAPTLAQLVIAHPKEYAGYVKYLGLLGGGARLEMGNYIGTGTSGADHPNSITFQRPPKLFCLYGSSYLDDSVTLLFSGIGSFTEVFMDPQTLTTEYAAGKAPITTYSNRTYGYAKISADKKTISWYSTLSGSGGTTEQHNINQYTYYWFALA